MTSSFAFLGKALTNRERAERQARLLLQRYGILVKEWYRHERGLLPWYDLFQVLKKLEWQGEIRRGYFIAGLSGVQFALPKAVELLENIQTGQSSVPEQPVLLSTIDPALPFGGAIDWNLNDTNNKKVTVTRLQSNHIIFIKAVPVLYSENYGKGIWLLSGFAPDMLAACLRLIKSWLQLPADIRPRKRIEIEQINGQKATELGEPKVFLDNGFEKDGGKFVLWPSGV